MRIGLLLSIALLLAVGMSRAGAEEELAPGLFGEYYDYDRNITDFPVIEGKRPFLRRVDKTINFESTEGCVADTDASDHMSAKWTGFIRIAKAGRYTFFLESDDGSRMSLDGKNVLNDGGIHGMQEAAVQLDLTVGDHAVLIEYFENIYAAGCKFSWQPEGQPKTIVPAEVLFHKRSAEKAAAAPNGPEF